MTIEQPSAPSIPGSPASPAPPAVSAEVGQAIQAANAAARDAAREGARAAAQAAQGVAQAGARPGAAVIKDASGRVVVTGADGRTVIIDPKAGLDQEAIQDMVQTALAPAPHFSPPRGPAAGDVAMVAIIFPCLLVMVWMITRAFNARRSGSGGAALAPDVAARLARIEQAVEAVAIEVERISEAQRYSARLLTERLPDTVPAIPLARAEPQPRA